MLFLRFCKFHDFMLDFEKYLSDFNTTVNIWEFLLNLIIVTLIAFAIKFFYVKWGRAISNRDQFSNNFVPLALATLLIITVIKSSIALSLGLVGALSIVRFRAAIKDPEELTYLFLVIGLGLIGGANKPVLAVVSFAIILPLLYVNNRVAGKKRKIKNKTFLHIDTSSKDLEKYNKAISAHTSFLELKRVDYKDNGMHLSYYCQVSSPENIGAMQNAINTIDNSAQVSFVDQPDLLA